MIKPKKSHITKSTKKYTNRKIRVSWLRIRNLHLLNPSYQEVIGMSRVWTSVFWKMIPKVPSMLRIWVIPRLVLWQSISQYHNRITIKLNILHSLKLPTPSHSKFWIRLNPNQSHISFLLIDSQYCRISHSCFILVIVAPDNCCWARDHGYWGLYCSFFELQGL